MSNNTKLEKFKISYELSINPITNSIQNTDIKNIYTNIFSLSPAVYSPANVIETPSSLLNDDTNKIIWKKSKLLSK